MKNKTNMNKNGIIKMRQHIKTLREMETKQKCEVQRMQDYHSPPPKKTKQYISSVSLQLTDFFIYQRFKL